MLVFLSPIVIYPFLLVSADLYPLEAIKSFSSLLHFTISKESGKLYRCLVNYGGQ
jgi:hypothetical protein